MSFLLKSWDITRAGVFKLGLNLARQTSSAEVRALINKLTPQDCGKELIRIGGNGDGGYLVPDDLNGIKYCFSPGVSTIADFEDQLANVGIRSFLADYSVDAPPVARQEMIFDKKFLGSTDRGQFITLASWKDKYIADYTGDLLLQMDIEGSEYQVIFNTPDKLLDQFRILLIEFHRLDRLFEPVFFELIQSCFEKILAYFHVAHIHPNNCCGSVRKGNIEIPKVMEFTFFNKKRVSETKPASVFPHKLDYPNTSNKDLRLPPCWYRKK
jgi:hypothetical protein